jgi:hypothetical protein
MSVPGLLDSLLEALTEHLAKLVGEQFDDVVKPHLGTRLARLLHLLGRLATSTVACPRWLLVALAFGSTAAQLGLSRAGVSLPTWNIALGFSIPALVLSLWTAWAWKKGAIGVSPTNYRSDTFAEMGSIVWRWAWKENRADPGDGTDIAARIIDLRSFCPKCGKRFLKNPYERYDYMFEQTISQTAYICGPPCNYQQILHYSERGVTTEIHRLIEQKVMNGDWRKTVEKSE